MNDILSTLSVVVSLGPRRCRFEYCAVDLRWFSNVSVYVFLGRLALSGYTYFVLVLAARLHGVQPLTS